MRLLPRKVAVIGLGLMGGSLARELAASGATVLAYDADPAVLSDALAAGVVHEKLDGGFETARVAELVVIATPVDVAIDTLSALVPHLSANATVTDVGSTKRAIAERAKALGVGGVFVGSHPLAGDHRSGFSASRTELFLDTHVFLCATDQTSPRALAAVTGFWSELGAKTEVVDAVEHDLAMAWVSHLPQVASSGVAAALSRSSYAASELGPGGRDVLRLARSSPEMWTAICLDNADNLAVALRELQERLAAFGSALTRADRAALAAYFEEGRKWLAL